ncbi:MAG: radical SAM family heme chaperone HemW [Candidatus Tectomicrobia bacterium]|uniref:Heme chaperone HemW n=1 Tax=Tectimicrobiota bacterium TaxID=2528274 RepID=A0A937W6D4_UNCTE|nr:radical SAM family heme chaperone HemW [Candidatus Tectomicrobia bacterium]
MHTLAPPFGLYVHIPFCPQRCPYCAFTILTGHTELYERYVAAVCTEIRSWHHLASKGPLHTVFFGGGTPSLLAPAQIQRILHTAVSTFGLAAHAEVTLEANPTTADAQHFAAFHARGITRLSLGVQSFHDIDLQTLGRWHSAADAETAYRIARQVGFTNVSIDVIFSIPGATRQRWQTTVERLLDLAPEHISTYALTIEEGTRFARREHQGHLTPVTEEDDAWAYAWVMETLASAGYQHYEVSNFARPGYRSQHNWGYWHGADYLGVGLSAHSLLDGQRHWNRRGLHAYLTAVEAGQAPQAGAERLDAVAARLERLWLQLRTCTGVIFQPQELQVLLSDPKFQAMLDKGLLHLHDTTVHLTPAGFLFADAIGVEVAALLERAAAGTQRPTAGAHNGKKGHT